RPRSDTRAGGGAKGAPAGEGGFAASCSYSPSRVILRMEAGEMEDPRRRFPQSRGRGGEGAAGTWGRLTQIEESDARVEHSYEARCVASDRLDRHEEGLDGRV